MKKIRLHTPNNLETVYHHCVSHVLDGRFAMDDEGKEQFLHLMRQQEKICRLRVVGHCIMSNHFHVLVEVPAPLKTPFSEAEILAHIASCYGKRHARLLTADIQFMRAGGASRKAQRIFDAWRERIGDLGSFMKTLKQCFTLWFNKRQGRHGTLWEDRYSTTIIEKGAALAMVGAYIDLNPVRAGLVQDPKKYPWSNYGAAVAGDKLAMRGLETLVAHTGTPPPKGRTALEVYGMILSGKVLAGPWEPPPVNPEERYQGRRPKTQPLSRAEMLRHRVRYFTDGAAVGSREFINQIFDIQKERFSAGRKDGARPMRGADFGGLCALRDLRPQPAAPAQVELIPSAKTRRRARKS